MKKIKYLKCLVAYVVTFSLFSLGLFAKDIKVSDLAGQLLSKNDYKKLVKMAKKVSPPKNGKNYVFGFANLQRDIEFGVKVESGIVKNLKLAGIKSRIADNRLDGPTALQNAQSFVRREVDFVIEFQTDANFGNRIMSVFNKANTGVIAIDIPMPGATFFGANNAKSGFMGGSYLAQYAINKWGMSKVKKGYLIIGDLPQSGAIVAMRTGGERAGFLAEVLGFPKDHVIDIDTKNTRQEAFAQMKNVLNRIPKGALILGASINDQAALGMLQATKRAQKLENSAFVGMGADTLSEFVKEEKFIASVGYFPENYGNYLVPLALMKLAGKSVPDAVLLKHTVVDDSNICKFYKKYKCKKSSFKYKFPQSKFSKHVADLRNDEDLKGYENLIPND